MKRPLREMYDEDDEGCCSKYISENITPVQDEQQTLHVTPSSDQKTPTSGHKGLKVSTP